MATPAKRKSSVEDDREDKDGIPSVTVSVRIRPPEEGKPVAIWEKPASEGQASSSRVVCHRGHMLEEYEFSRVFGHEEDNKTVFEEVGGDDLVSSVFSGVNETVFAYGQTGSGKTFTIFGSDEELGMLQFVVQSVFRRASQLGSCNIHVCSFEILGDNLTDLIEVESFYERGMLSPDDVVIDELFLKTQKYRYQIVRVEHMTTLLELLENASINRMVGVSSYNDRSSRSHAVVQFFIQNKAGAVENGHGGTLGALTLVDLAGSEKEHENPTEQGRKSARILNTSLSSLNRLLRNLQSNTLNDSDRRQSVLNKVLWEYVRGGCGIALIFCVSPLLKHRTVSLSTLAMATDSKTISSKRKQQYLQVDNHYVQLQNPYVTQSPCQSGRAQSAGYPGTPYSVQEMASPLPPSPSTPSSAVLACNVRDRALTLEERCARTGVPPETPQPPSRRMSDSGWSAKSCDFGEERGSPTCHLSLHEGAEGANQATDMYGADRGISTEELKRMCERSPVSLHELVVQNTKLQTKLNHTRKKSRERMNRVEEERKQLNEENVSLRDECRSLRNLFLRQQQQQIAFWSGSLLDGLGPSFDSERPLGHRSSSSGMQDRRPSLAEGPPQFVEEASSSRGSSAVGQPVAASSGAGSADVPPDWVPTDEFWKAQVQKLRQELLQKQRVVPSRAMSGQQAPKKMHATALQAPQEPSPLLERPDPVFQDVERERDYWRSVATKLRKDIDVKVSAKTGDSVTRSLPQLCHTTSGVTMAHTTSTGDSPLCSGSELSTSSADTSSEAV